MATSERRRHAIKNGYRSGLEDDISKDLKDRGVQFEYESMKIYWELSEIKSYTPDFILPNNLIIESKISRVIISSLDPNPLVNGKSVKQLRKYGIKVKTGVLKKESLELNKGFFSKFIKKRPHVTAKFGVSLDGKISLLNGTSKWITSLDSRKDVQEERASRSLIFTSSKTVLRDNPQMTIRDSICD